MFHPAAIAADAPLMTDLNADGSDVDAPSNYVRVDDMDACYTDEWIESEMARGIEERVKDQRRCWRSGTMPAAVKLTQPWLDGEISPPNLQ